jgi:glutaredoxin
MFEWEVLTRDGCSLCEAFVAELAEALGPARAAEVRVVDVDADPTLKRKYGHRVPVLRIDGEFVCDYRLDHERLAPYLQAVGDRPAP